MKSPKPPRRRKVVPTKVLLSFRKISDPTATEVRRVKQAVADTPGAEVISEISGAIEIAVEPGHEFDLRQKLSNLRKWDVVLEGVAEMPATQGLDDM